MSSRTETCPYCHRKMARTSATRKTYECRNPKCKGAPATQQRSRSPKAVASRVTFAQAVATHRGRR